MMRVAFRGAITVLALVLVFASAGVVLCETDCVASERAASAGASMNDGFGHDTGSHCAGEPMDSARHDTSTPNRNSSGNTKHTGAHLHPRLVATATAEIQIAPAITLSDFAVTAPAFISNLFARAQGNLWTNDSSPPINSPEAFSTRVLRI
jgi:hypothetical protein